MCTPISTILHPATVNSETCPSASLAPIPNPQSAIRNFPLEVLPDFLRPFPLALAAAAPVSLEFAALACLGALSAAAGARCFLRDGERLIRPNLYFLNVAPDDLSRSTALRLVCESLNRHQSWIDVGPDGLPSDDSEEFEEPRYDKDGWPCPRSQNPPQQRQTKPLYYHPSIPRGKLLPTLADRPAHALSVFDLHADDSANLLRNPTPETAIYIAAHAGTSTATPHHTQRGQVQRTLITPCLNLHWTITPETWSHLLTAPNLSKSALLPRFLFAWPDSVSETCPLTTDVDPQKSEIRNLQSEIPDVLPTISEDVTSEWSQTICFLLNPDYPKGTTALEFPVTPEARKILRAYENEIRHSIAESADSLYRTSAAHHPDTAWRLALLLHAATVSGTEFGLYGPTPLPLETAVHAITLTRWFAHQQQKLITHFHDQADLRLLQKITRALTRAGGTITLGQLTDRQNLTPEQALHLATKFPHLLHLTESTTATPGRKPQSLTLLTFDKTSALHPTDPTRLRQSEIRNPKSEIPPAPILCHPENPVNPVKKDPMPLSEDAPHTSPTRPTRPTSPNDVQSPVRPQKSDFSDRPKSPKTPLSHIIQPLGEALPDQSLLLGTIACD